MRFHEFTALLEAGEGITVEFKRRFSSPEKIVKEMIAFANTRGGTLLFGVDDDASIVGVSSEKEEMEMIAHAAEFLSDPPLRYTASIISTQGRDIVCIEVPESDHKPHFLVEPGAEEPVAYVRVGEHSVQASREMVSVMRHRSGETGPVRLVIGEAERRLFAWFETHDRVTVAEFARITNLSTRRASRLLVRLVRAGVLAIHTLEKSDYFTLLQPPQT